MAYYDNVIYGKQLDNIREYNEMKLHTGDVSNDPNINQPMYDEEKFKQDLENYKTNYDAQIAEQQNTNTDNLQTYSNKMLTGSMEDNGIDNTYLINPIDEKAARSPLLENVVQALPDAERNMHSDWYEFLQYKYEDDRQAAELKRFEKVLGIDATQVFGDRETYQELAVAAAKVEKIAKFKNLYKDDDTIDFEKVYSSIPGFGYILKTEGPLSAAMAVANMDGVAKINEVYEGSDQFFGSIKAGYEKGLLQNQRNLIGAAANKSMRYLTPEEEAEVKRLDAEIANNYEMSYSNFYDTTGGMIGEAASQGSLFLYNLIGKTVGVGAGVLAAKTGIGAAYAPAIAKWTGKAASIALMTNEMAGAHYLENIEKLDKNGNRMYTPEQAAALSTTQGLLEGVIEEYTIGQYCSSLFTGGGKKHITEYISKSFLAGESENVAKLGLSKIVQGRIKELGLKQALADVNKKQLAKAITADAGNYIKETAKGSSMEIYEEIEQQLASMVTENVFQAALKGKDAEYYSLEEIAGESLASGIMAISATGGFFLAGLPAKAVGMSVNGALNKYSLNQYMTSEAFRDSVENQNRISTITNVQQAIAEGNVVELQNNSAETLEAIIDAKNEEIGAETTMVDVKALYQMEGGEAIANKIAEAAGITQEELNGYLKEEHPGMMAVQTSKIMLMQQDSKITDALNGNISCRAGALTENKREKLLEERKESLKLLRKIAAGKTDAEIIDKAINDAFTDEKQRSLARDILNGKYGEDPAKGVAKLRDQIISEIDELLAPEINQLMGEAKQGTVFLPNTMRDDDGVMKVSVNVPWYRNWFKANRGKRWGLNEARYIAWQAVNNNDVYGVGFYYGFDNEGYAYVEEVKNKVNELVDKLEIVKDTAFVEKMRNLSYQNIMDMADLSPEARSEFDNILNALKSDTNKELNQASVVNAIAFLHYVDRRVAERKAAGQIDWTVAKELEKVKARVTAKGEQNSQQALNQSFDAVRGTTEAERKEFQSQYDAIVAKYKNTDQWMKAPNGQDTNLTEEQWVTVRTENFKKQFGDWETLAQNTFDGEKIVTSYKEAESRIANIRYKKLHNDAENIDATFSKKGKNKVISNAARRLSEDNGFTENDHYTIVANTMQLFKTAVLSKTSPDVNGEITSIKLFSSFCIVNKKPAVVIFTVKEITEGEHKVYSVQLVTIEKPAGTLPRAVNKQPSASAGLSVNIVPQKDEKLNSNTKENSEIPTIVYKRTSNKEGFEEVNTKELANKYKNIYTNLDENGEPKLDGINNSLNQIIGEKGAMALDVAEEVTTRIDYLNVAREMETSGKNAKTIKLATGWERGADGKWNYEIDDRKIEVSLTGDILYKADHPEYKRYKDLARKANSALILGTEKLSPEEQKEYESLRNIWNNEPARLFKRVENGQATLKEILKDDELFTAYPDIANIKIVFTDMNRYIGQQDEARNEIKLDISLKHEEKRLKSVLLHEVQHAIQAREGFAYGTNTKSAREQVTSQLTGFIKDETAYDDLQKVYYNLTALNNIMDARRVLKNPRYLLKTSWYQANGPMVLPKNKNEQKEILNKLAEKYVSEIYDDSWSNTWGNFYWNSLEMSDEEIKKEIASLTRKAKSLAKEAGPYMRASSMLEKLDELSDYEIYQRIAGEVQSRNVEARINMSMAERMNTLLSDTEDVARKDQIVLENLKNQALGNMANAKPTNSYGIPMERVTSFQGNVTKEQLKQALSLLAGKTLHNNIENIDAYVNVKQRDKLASNAAAEKSKVNGFDYGQHNDIARQIENLWRWSVLAVEEKERTNSGNIRPLRFVSPIKVNDEDVFAWMTVKLTEYGYRIYSIELMNEQKLRSTLNMTPATAVDDAPILSFDDIVSKLSGNVNAQYQVGDLPNAFYQMSSQLNDGEKKELAVFHNAKEDRLLKAIESGGLAVPSLAITKGDVPYDNYGSITLIGNKDLIDPANGVPVYSRDAYTVVTPRFFRQGKDNVYDKAVQFGYLFNDYAAKVGENKPEKIIDYLTYAINSDDYDYVYNHMTASNQVRAYYTENVLGKKVETQYKEEPSSKHFLADDKQIVDLALKYNREKVELNVENIEPIIKEYRDAMVRLRDNAKLQVVKKSFDKKIKLWDSMEYGRKYDIASSLVKNAERIFNPTPNKVIDYTGLSKQLVDRYNPKFNKWVEEQLQPFFGEEMVMVGNKAMPATLENITKAMLKEAGAGKEFGSMTPGVLAARGAKKFKTIDEIRRAKKSIDSEENVKAEIESNNQMVYELENAIADYYSYGNSYEAGEALMDSMANAINGGKKTNATKIKQQLNKNGFKEVPAELVDRIVFVSNRIKDTATLYFEAKPQRAVGVNEFVGAVVPNDADPILINSLINNGLQVELYDREDDVSRYNAQQKILQDQNVLFQNFSGIKGATIYGNQDAQGSYGQLMIKLFEQADQSTFMHELGHVYLLELQELAALDPNGQAAKDVETIRKWAAWNPNMLKDYEGAATYNEFAKLDGEIRQALKDGYVVRNGKQVTLSQLQDQWIQERFARGFETYLEKGQAPTPSLKRAFRKFKKWLMQIYSSTKGTGVQPSPEVEAIMARAFATEEAIEQNARINAINNLDIDEDMSREEVIAMHKRWQEEAKEEAKERMLSKILKDYKSRIKDEVDNVAKQAREEATERLRKERCYQVDALVEGPDNPLNLDEALLACGYEDLNLGMSGISAKKQYLKDKNKLGGNFDEAVEKAVKAAVKEFSSTFPAGQELKEMAEDELASLKAAEVVALEAEILSQREKKYNEAGGRLGTLYSEVDKAISENNPDKLSRKIKELKYAQRWKEAELNLLNEIEKAVSDKDKEQTKANADNIKQQFAEFKKMTLQNIEWLRNVRDASKKRVGTIRSIAISDMEKETVSSAMSVATWNREQNTQGNTALREITKAQRLNKDGKTEEANEAYNNAYDAKVKQTYLAAMTAQAAKIRQDVQKVLTKIEKRRRALGKKGSVKLTPEYRYYYDHLLYLYGFNKQDARKPADLRKFSEFWQEVTKNGDVDFELDLDTDFIALMDQEKIACKYNQLKVEQFREISKIMDVLYTLGKNQNSLLTLDVSMDQVRKECEEAFRENIGKAEQDKLYEELSSLKKLLGSYEISLLRPEVMLEVLSGAGRGVYKYVYDILQKATENEAVAKEKEAVEFKNLLESYYGQKERRRFDEQIETATLPDGSKLTKNKLLSMALNWGNKTNQARLYTCLYADEYGNIINPEVAKSNVEDYFKQYMSKKDWEFVQAVWNHIGRYANDVSAVVEKINGVPMKRVEPNPFSILTKDNEVVQLAGGYYPIVSNPSKDSSVNEQKEIEEAAVGRQSLGSGMGSTKERANSLNLNRPMLLDLSIISRHVNQQIHIANMRLACRDAYKVLQDKRIRKLVQLTWGMEGYNALSEWILDCWKPATNQSSIERMVGMIRGNTIGAIMAYRIGTGLLNIANIVPMVNEIGAMNTLNAFYTYLKNPMQIRQFVFNDSIIMRSRAEKLDADLNTVQESAFGDDHRFVKSINKYANWFIAETDMICSIPLYYWRYQDTLNKSIQEGKDARICTEEAHAAATKAVRNVFGSTDMVDRSKVQREKSEFVKALIPFFTFSNTMYNAVAKEFYVAAKGGTNTISYNEQGNISGIDYNRGDLKSRYTRAVQATLMLFVLMPLIETVIRQGIDSLTSSGDDDKKDKDIRALLAKIGMDWAKNSLTAATGSLYGINLAVESIGRLMDGKYSGGRSSTGVIGGAADRVEKTIVSIAKVTQGKGSAIDVGRNLTRVANTVYGTPDTFSDFIFNSAQFINDYDRYHDIDAWREYLAKSAFDRKLKAKK